ncbi:hypothetical protein [Rhizobium chutanense]|uniref:hypothetical protein n=1 Tax=Rhizobium chutanense TaxID=2035448 RepID=UPI00117BCCA6|nr:hypothetical protein [Rhizobium chutanense]
MAASVAVSQSTSPIATAPAKRGQNLLNAAAAIKTLKSLQKRTNVGILAIRPISILIFQPNYRLSRAADAERLQMQV